MCITLWESIYSSLMLLFVLPAGHVTWLLPRTVLLEDSGYPGYALRSGQQAAKRSEEHDVDLCPSQIVGLAGQWSGPQSISASIYLSSEAEQRKIPGHTHTRGSD